MNEVWAHSFELATLRHFGALAAQVGLKMVKLREGIFEISGIDFVIRIRRGIGYHRDFFVTVAARCDLSSDVGDPTGEIGLGRAAKFNGSSVDFGNVNAVGNLEVELEKAAKWSREFIIDYLTGGRTDFEDLRKFEGFPLVVSPDVKNLPHNVKKVWEKT